MTTDDLCKGCPSNQFDDCIFYHFNSKCPCVKCLVKVTCDISCRDYDIFEENHVEQIGHKAWKKERIRSE